MPRSGSAGPASARLLAARSTSARVMVPPGPVACTRLRSTSSLRASARTAGSTCRVRARAGSAGASACGRRFSSRPSSPTTVPVSCFRTFGKLDQGRAHLDEIALGAEQARDAAAPRRRDLDHGLVGLDRHQRLIDDDVIALVDVPGDDLRLFEAFAEIRQHELAHGEFPHRFSRTGRLGARRPRCGRPTACNAARGAEAA